MTRVSHFSPHTRKSLAQPVLFHSRYPLLAAYEEVPLRLMDVDLAVSLELAAAYNLYAYDAYVLTCAAAQRAPLLTLDKGHARAATAAGVRLKEIES